MGEKEVKDTQVTFRTTVEKKKQLKLKAIKQGKTVQEILNYQVDLVLAG